MIQPVKLDSPTLTREPAQGDSGNGGFSSMLANLVDPGNGPSRSQADPPQNQGETSETSPNKPQEPQQQVASSPSTSPQTGEQESAAPTPIKPVISPKTPPALPIEPGPQAPEAPAAQGPPVNPIPVQTKVSNSSARVPMDFPKPVEIGEPTQTPPTEMPSLSPEAVLAATLQASAPTQSASTPDELTEVTEDQKDPETDPTSSVIPLVPALAPPITAQAPIAQATAPSASAAVTAMGAMAPEPIATEVPAPVVATPQAPPTAKPAPKQQPRIQEQTTSDTSTQAPLIRKDTPAVSEEPLFEPIRIKTKANSTQDTPTPQTAEAALGLKPPSPKPALTEFLSRPIPAMETPSVVHAIQEAKGASTTQAVPLAAPLPGIESSQSPELFQGRESRSGRGAQSEAQSNPSATPTTTFTLNAPMAALAKATVPEVAATRPSLPMEQMEGTVRWVLNNQQNSAELQLRPESLGKVQIQLKVEGNQVHAKVWASESSTVPLLESHRGMLEASLREQGLSLGSFDLRHGQGAPRHPMDQPSGQASFAGPVLDFGKEPSLEIPAISTPGVFGNRRVEVFA